MERSTRIITASITITETALSIVIVMILWGFHKESGHLTAKLPYSCSPLQRRGTAVCSVEAAAVRAYKVIKVIKVVKVVKNFKNFKNFKNLKNLNHLIDLGEFEKL